MAGSRRILTLLITVSLILPGSTMTFVVDPAKGQNAVDRFFGRIGNAFRGRRSRQEQPAVQQPDPARRGAHFDAETRKRIQARLNELGHNVGDVDGIFGNATQRGISDYQKTIGAESTGILTKEQAGLLLAKGPPALEPESEDRVGPSSIEGAEAEIIANEDSVWGSLAIRTCKADELQECMTRFGAPEKAIAFVNALSKTKLEAGPLVHFEDFGRVDMGEIGYPWDERKSALVLLNGGPPAISTETDLLPPITIDGPTYRKLLDRYGELGLVGRPNLRSHRLTASGGQRFVFAYRLARCEDCATPGEVLIGYDFEPGGRYLGTRLLGVWSRDPDMRWPGTGPLSVDILTSDSTAVSHRLANLGFDAGDTETETDTRIKAALTAFQKDHGTGGSGELDTKTAKLLATPDIGIEIDRFDQIYRTVNGHDRFDYVLENGISLLSRAERRTETGAVALARLNSRIARLYLRKRDPRNALPYAERAVSISAEANRQPGQIHGLYLVSLGETYLALDQKQNAVVNFTAALDVFQGLTTTGSKFRRDLAAKSFMRTGVKLMDLHEKMDNSLARETIRKRLDAVEQDMASAQ